MFLVFVLLMLEIVSRGNAIVFSYMHNVEDLLQTQKYVIKSIKYHLPYVEDTKKGALLKYIARCEKEQSIAAQNVKKYFYNPLNAYTLVKRLHSDLNVIEHILITGSSKGYNYKRQSKLRYPTAGDMQAANVAMSHLIITYKLNLSELANGTLKGNFNNKREPMINYVSPISSSDCYELAMAAHSVYEYETSLAWIKEALRKYHDDCDGDCTYTENDLIEFIKLLLDKLDQIESTENDYRSKGINNVMAYEMTKAKLKNQGIANQGMKIWERESSYLCLKEIYNHSSSLNCQYKAGPHPFLTLARLKAETIHLEPEVIMFHDVISDEEIYSLKKLALKEFQANNSKAKSNKNIASSEVSYVIACDAVYDTRSTIRQAACLNDSTGPAAAVTRRARHITGLTLPAQDFVTYLTKYNF